MTNPMPYDRVKAARSSKRPTGLDYLRRVFTGFFELHGDRRSGDDSAVVAGTAYLGDRAVTVISIEKGHTAKERTDRHFGNPHPEGYRKALRLMKQAEKFRRPVICFIDTAGAYCGVEAEEHGQGQAIAENLMSMMQLNVPIISIQPFTVDGFENAVKVRTMNLADHEDLQRQIGYQIRKFNACRKCLKCESVCRSGAISITAEGYRIDEEKCVHCKMCVNQAVLANGCLMAKYLRTKGGV